MPKGPADFRRVLSLFVLSFSRFSLFCLKTPLSHRYHAMGKGAFFIHPVSAPLPGQAGVATAAGLEKSAAETPARLVGLSGPTVPLISLIMSIRRNFCGTKGEFVEKPHPASGPKKSSGFLREARGDQVHHPGHRSPKSAVRLDTLDIIARNLGLPAPALLSEELTWEGAKLLPYILERAEWFVQLSNRDRNDILCWLQDTVNVWQRILGNRKEESK